MRRWPALILGALIALSGCTAAGARPTIAHTRAAGTVLFADSFNGTTLDRANWNDSWFGTDPNPSKPVNSAEDDCYDPRQVNVGGGQLTITATKRSCLGYSWASGLINTNGKFSFTTGTLKAKVCLQGVDRIDDWPAVWSDGQRWPYDGEIDLLEGLGGVGRWHVHSTAPTVGGGSLGPSCHRIRYKRTANTVSFFYDGVKQGSASTSSFSTRPHYLVINLAVSSSISPPEVAAQLHLDWVQVTA